MYMFTLWFDLTQNQIQSPDLARGKPKVLDFYLKPSQINLWSQSKI